MSTDYNDLSRFAGTDTGEKGQNQHLETFDTLDRGEASFQSPILSAQKNTEANSILASKLNNESSRTQNPLSLQEAAVKYHLDLAQLRPEEIANLQAALNLDKTTAAFSFASGDTIQGRDALGHEAIIKLDLARKLWATFPPFLDLLRQRQKLAQKEPSSDSTSHSPSHPERRLTQEELFSRRLIQALDKYPHNVFAKNLRFAHTDTEVLQIMVDNQLQNPNSSPSETTVDWSLVAHTYKNTSDRQIGQIVDYFQNNQAEPTKWQREQESLTKQFGKLIALKILVFKLETNIDLTQDIAAANADIASPDGDLLTDQEPLTDTPETTPPPDTLTPSSDSEQANNEPANQEESTNQQERHHG